MYLIANHAYASRGIDDTMQEKLQQRHWEQLLLTFPKIQKVMMLPMPSTPSLATGRGMLAGTKLAILLVTPLAAARIPARNMFLVISCTSL